MACYNVHAWRLLALIVTLGLGVVAATIPGLCDNEGCASEGDSHSLLQVDRRKRSGAASATNWTRCPKVETVADFSIDEYIRASWYVQEQQTVAYQSEEQLDCVVASYDKGGKVFGLFQGETLSVYNFFKGGRPTADAEGNPIAGSQLSQLCASVTNRDTPSKLKVAPCFLPPRLAGGDYWVIDVGKSMYGGAYEWAIISGGNPKEKFDDGCTTQFGSKAYFNAGLWIFSRTRELAPEKLMAARKSLVDKGYTTSKLLKVTQAGCTYEGAFIKS